VVRPKKTLNVKWHKKKNGKFFLENFIK
jgi:hypothetical protein